MGYSVDMFVNISDSDKPELTCSICQDIFKDPVITNCCLQTFCKECINDWLKDNNTCPFDREKLTSSQISRPPRLILNLLGKLELKCDNYRNGCKDILRLENFETHLLNCKFNSKECNICHCLVTANHNCVESLLELNRKSNEEIKSLKSKSQTSIASNSSNDHKFGFEQYLDFEPNKNSDNSELQKLKKEIKYLENERDNFLKTISQMAEIESKSKKSDITYLKELRYSLSTYKIIEQNMSKEMVDIVIYLLRKEIDMTDSVHDLSKNIVSKLDDRYGVKWHCVCAFDHFPYYYYTFEHMHELVIEFGALKVKIFKTKFFTYENFKNRFNSKLLDFNIIKLDMKDRLIQELKAILFASINPSNSLSELSKRLKQEMQSKFGGIWICLMYSNNGGSYFTYKSDSYLNFQIGEVDGVVFQSV